MPKYIAKFNELYCEWSTVVDAPVSWLMPLDEFKEYYRAQYGENGLRDLPDRLGRVENQGTSAIDGFTPADLFGHNRAGPREGRIRTVERLIALYGPDRPRGSQHA